MGYSESSKAYKVYLPESRQIEVNRDVTFEEEMAFRKARGSDMEIDDEEHEAPKEMITSSLLAVQRELPEKAEPIDSIDPVQLVDVPRDVVVGQKSPRWEKQTLQDSQGHKYPHGNFWERKITQRFLIYVALMSHIVDSELYTYEESSMHQV